MKIYRSWDSESSGVVESSRPARRENLDIPRQQEVADVMGVARCPRCGNVLVATIHRGAAGFRCRCPVRRVRALPIPA